MAARKTRTAGRVLRRRNTKRRRPRRRARRLPDVARYAANAGVVAMTGVAALAAFVAFFARDLPATDGLWAAERSPRLTLLAIDGAPMSVHGMTSGAPIRLADLPPYAPQAVLAVEDRNFYHHVGFNPISVARAIFVNVGAGEVRQGGSTITQQLAKNLFLSPDRTLRRKIQELLLALWLEHQFTKDEILTLYLNRVYFGAGAYGIDAASRRYFDKPARDLSLGEAAVLAGILKAPSRYAPTHNPGDAGARARMALDAMEEAQFISGAAARRARAEPVYLAAPNFAAAPYFADHILQETHDLSLGVDADLVVQTTFDPQLQSALEAGLAAGLAAAPIADDVQVAAVILDAEGGVRAMIGGRDYAGSQFNRAAQARRQPGSAFKPFVFLAALEAGMEPQDRLLDAPIKIDKWAPDNYGGRYFGDVSLTDALALSLNSATIRVQEHIGRSAVRLEARRAGFQSVSTKGPALALGVDAMSPLELAGAYAPLANGGFRVKVHAIDSIRTIDGQSIHRRQAAMIDAAASYRSVEKLNAMLAAVIQYGTGRAAAVPGWNAVGKTGTTQDSRDAWFAGHVGGLVCVVWVGRDDNAPMRGVTGGGAPAIIWREAMRRALAERAPRPEPPQPIAPAEIAGEPADPLAALLSDGL